jgi:hypothetical protein
MQKKIAYIRPKMVVPFPRPCASRSYMHQPALSKWSDHSPDPAQAGATFTGLPFYYLIKNYILLTNLFWSRYVNDLIVFHPGCSFCVIFKMSRRLLILIDKSVFMKAH